MLITLDTQITNSAPDHSVLGTLNGLAQTLSAAGRAAGPFISGSLFTAATHVKPKGEAMAFGIFGGVAFIGFILSFWIRGDNLESPDYDDEEEGDAQSDEDVDDAAAHANGDAQPCVNERTRLVNGRR